MHDLSEGVKVLLGTVVIAIMVLSWVARKRPDITWLRSFNLGSHLTEEQKRSIGRTQNFTAGAQFILLGLVIPLGYLFLTAATFGDFETGEISFVAAISLLCIVLGAYGIAKSRTAT